MLRPASTLDRDETSVEAVISSKAGRNALRLWLLGDHLPQCRHLVLRVPLAIKNHFPKFPCACAVSPFPTSKLLKPFICSWSHRARCYSSLTSRRLAQSLILAEQRSTLTVIERTRPTPRPCAYERAGATMSQNLRSPRARLQRCAQTSILPS